LKSLGILIPNIVGDAKNADLLNMEEKKFLQKTRRAKSPPFYCISSKT
jgi:hypothetical protein